MEFVNPYRMFNGSWVPNWLLERPELSLGTKVTYARLAQYAGKNGVAYPRMEVLGRSLGISGRQASTHVAELVAHGLIHVESGKQAGTANKYHFRKHPWFEGGSEENFRGGQKDSSEGGRKKTSDRRESVEETQEETICRDASLSAPMTPEEGEKAFHQLRREVYLPFVSAKQEAPGASGTPGGATHPAPLPSGANGGPIPLVLEPSPEPASAGRKRKPAGNPRFTPLRDRLVAVFLALKGHTYGFDGGRDAKAITRLMAMEASDDEIERRWRRALGLGRWPGCSTLSHLADRWNDLANQEAGRRAGGMARAGTLDEFSKSEEPF